MAKSNKSVPFSFDMLTPEQKATIAAEYIQHKANQPPAKPQVEPDMDPRNAVTEAQVKAEARELLRNGEVSVTFHKVGVNKSGNIQVVFRVSAPGFRDSYASLAVA